MKDKKEFFANNKNVVKYIRSKKPAREIVGMVEAK